MSKASYKEIVKATGIFGGVQVVTIIISIVRSKIVAILLGPEGVGINGLFNSTTSFISGITNLGLGISSVRSISEANKNKDKTKVSKVILIIRKLIWITGTIGILVVVIFSKTLSEFTFNSDAYTISFIIISITLLFNQLAIGQNALLQGLRKIKLLANSTITGAIFGLITSIPLYYYFGLKGIVPAIVITSILNYLRSWYFARKVKIEKVSFNKRELFDESKIMLTTGFLLSISNIYVLAKNYGIRIIISNAGGVSEVGLYSAGIIILNTYVGMIFKAMSTDYFPRLSAVASDKIKANELINNQAEIALIIITPLLLLFMLLINYIIILLYSNRFAEINNMLLWGAPGLFFKSASWSIGFIFLSKGDNKIFALNEFLSVTISFIITVVFYSTWGLSGIGISFLVGFIYHLFQVFIFSYKLYSFSFSVSFLKLFAFQLILILGGFLTNYFLEEIYRYIAGSMIFMISFGFSYIELDKRLNIKRLVNKFLKR